MSEFNLDKVLELLGHARDQGINVSLAGDQLSVRFEKGNTIDKAMLAELKLNKPFLIHYFKTHAAKGKGPSLLHLQKTERDAVNGLPVSYAQERLWFIDQLEGSVQYHIPCVLQLRGDLNIDALKYAMQQIVDRHEVLRTVIREKEGKAWQYIQPQGGWQLNTVDGAAYRDDPDSLQKYIQDLISTPFDLSKDYMMRAHLISISVQYHVLVVTLHHISSDGWSTSIIVKELVELYNAFENGRKPDLLPLPIQYADFAHWQRKYLQGEVLDKKLAYWKTKLQGVPTLQLPVDYERPAIQSLHGATASFAINADLTGKIKLLGQEQGATLFMTLLAAFNVLLYRHTGQPDICIGTPIAGRDQQETEALIGFFINSLALRNDLSNDPSFTSLLKQVKSNTLEAYDNKELPFEKVVEAVVKERSLSYSPVFQVMFALQNLPDVPEFRLGKVTMSAGNFDNLTAKYDLTFFITETDNGLHGSVRYCTDLFKEQTILTLITHFTNLLKVIVEAPHEHIGALPMLTNEGQQQLLVEFNETTFSYPKDKTIVELFEEQVNKTPSAIAIVFEEESITYKELDNRSNQVANHLMNNGIHPGTNVGLLAYRSIEMIVAMLGIVKAGCAYIPFNTEYPLERIRVIIEEAAIEHIVYTSDELLRSTGLSALVFININDVAACSPASPMVRMPTDAKVYIMFTSGTTGRPKGIIVNQLNIIKLVYDNGPIKVLPSDRVLQWSNYSFDGSTYDIYSSLLMGASLCLIPDQSVSDLDALSKIISSQKITVCFMTTALFNAFIDLQPGLFRGLRKILFGGEKASVFQVKKAFSLLGAGKIVHVYGPTETTVYACSYAIDTADFEAGVPIGKPLSNTQFFVLNDQRYFAPVGVAGELYIGGDGVSNGYVNNEALTAEKFIINPFTNTPNDKLYRTGDVVRWLADGNVEYLGRVDDQVKIRGYRIEPGEIENVLRQSGYVGQSVVLARENKEGNKRLVGYIVPKAGFSKESMIEYLQDHLPEYMIPTSWVKLDALPLTPNGKIDRKALPDVDPGDLLEKGYVAPGNALETRLAEIWQGLLAVERVGIHDNFFELGGDSILTIQVVSRARRIGLELKPKDLFINQTISKLSAAIAARSAETELGEQGILTGPVGLLPIQQWWLEMEQPGIGHFNQAVLLGIDKNITASLLGQAFDRLAEQHDALRCKFFQQNNKWQQEYGTYKSEVITEDFRSVAQGLFAAAITEKSTAWQQSLHIEKGELLRVVWMQTPDSEKNNRLLIVIHHLVIDGVSWRILLEDLELLLNGFINGQKTNLLPKSSSTRQWYHALENYGGRKILRAQGNYWRQAAKSYSPLPVDKAYQETVKVKDLAQIGVRLDAVQTSHLLHDVPRVYHTEINDLLLAALACTLSEWSGHEKINIGMEGHGREEIAPGIDTSRTVGWFTSLYPLLLTMPPLKGEASLIKSIKEQLRQLPGKGLGYGVLKYINKDPGLQGPEPWDIVFNYLGQLDNVVSESKWLTGATESAGPGRSGEQMVHEKITVNSSVRAGELILGWSFSSKHYQEATIKKLAEAYLSNLQKLVAHCLEQQLSGGTVFTPSDYGLGAEISYEELDGFLEERLYGNKRKDLIDGLYPLSGLQQGMLFHGLYDAGVGAYIEQFGCELFGVDTEILTRSWEYLIKRHSILRSAFYFDAFTVPVQCVFKEAALPLVILDYRAMNEAGQAIAIREFDAADKDKGFDFKTAPLMRLALFRLGEDRYRMLWTSHHILYDGWSFPILMEEFLSNYELLSAGSPIVSGEEDRYEDYIRYLERSDKELEEQYWRNYLRGVEQNTLLPFIGATIARNKGEGIYQTMFIHLQGNMVAKIQAFAQLHHLTQNTIMQGVWAYLLHHYTGNKNIVFGIIVSGRPDDLSNVEQRVGMYINTLPFHSAIRNGQGIIEWLQGIQAEQVNSRQYQHTPFHVVQGWSGVQGDLFDTLLTFENYPISKVVTAKKWALSVGKINMQDHTNYPLSIVIGSAEQINIRFSYNAALLAEAYVKEIRDHFENVLLQIIDKGDALVSDISLLNAAAQNQLLEVFNDTRAGLPAGKTIIHLFEEQVIKTRDALALVFNEEKFSYHELNSRSNQLAHYLKSKGVTNETLVPVCIDRSIEMMVSILGILKAGGAYVPVDPGYPPERISYILQDTRASFVITNKVNYSKLLTAAAIDIIDMDGDSALIGQWPENNLNVAIGQHQLAYIIFTSGSTGKPKGVMIEHGSLLNYLLNNKTNYAGSAENKSGSFVHLSYTFDASITAMFMPLLWGKTVVIGAGQSVDIFEDSNLLRYAPYDFIKITPAHLALLQPKFKSFGKGLPTGKLVIGGEALHPAQFDSFIADEINVEVINEYGPTEATVGCTTYHFHTLADKDKIITGIPVGKPVDNVVIYILDDSNELVPIGVKGEICIGGAGLARGYLNLPVLTAEKFITDPFNKSNRIYKTGDIGRWLPDGNIEYMGRMDDQVKIRGYRVELGEIEHALQQCEMVGQAVVIAKEEPEGGRKLVSFYVPLPAAVRSRESELSIQRVASWKELYETEYGQTEGDETINPEFNIIGWNDSFTGEAIPAEQMKEWLNDIVDVVLSQPPGNVLEIGCGTGLIYYQLAGKVQKYIGCDLSKSSISQVTQRISKGLRNYGDTELFTAPAHEVMLQDGQQVDTILLNSMVQYFPGEEYMNTVMAKCIALLNGRGRIIIGDVRDNRLLELFKGRLRMQKLQDLVSVKEFKWGLGQDLLKEEELCFSPGYFYGLKKLYPEITQVDIQWKQAGYINELSLYRYTVVIYIGIEKELQTPQWQGWNDLVDKQTFFKKDGNHQNIVAIKDVPNPRLWKERLLQQALQNQSFRTMGDFMHVFENEDRESMQINQLLNLASEKGYRHKFLLHEDPLKINLLFERDAADKFIQSPLPREIQGYEDSKTNIPLFTDISFLLQKDIRALLHNSLPDYMVPSEFIALHQLPLTSNGKIDRLFLSQREDRVFVNKLNYLPPVTDMEKAIAEIWKELLHLERVGIEDDFFELGGHSLLAMRVISAIRKQLEVELNIKELFLNPTIGLLANHIQKLSKGLLLPAIEIADPRPARIPLSFSQERLWFIDQLDGSLQYHNPAVLRLKGDLDTNALSNALQQIINRHEILRTVIVEIEGQGYQHIKEKDGWQLSVVDGSKYKENEEGLQQYIQQLTNTPFNLTKDYMLRASLVSIDEEDHVLVATLHHIASDGWSVSILVGELAALYNAFVEKRVPGLANLPIQYADYAIWQRRYCQGEAWDKKLGYWQHQLEGIDALRLPADHPRPLVQSTNGAMTGIRIDKELSDQLQTFSQQQGATLFMTLLAAFNVLLYRYTGQKDICVGTPVAGRLQQELEGLIGFFVNTLALRTGLKDTGSFAELLQQVKATTLEAYNYQEVPFEKVVELVARDRDMSRSPLFQVMMVLQNTPDVEELRLGELQLSRGGKGSAGHNTSKFDLTFNITETAGGLYISAEYCTSLFNESTIQRMLAHFKELLKSVVKDAGQSIGEIPMLTIQERNQLLVEFNDTQIAYPKEKSIAGLFEEQSVKTPAAIAIIFDEEKITYRQLNEKANQLANYLRSKGVKEETLVPIYMDRGPAMIIAILAILKAGGGYVPIDVEYPEERIRFMLEDTAATIILTNRQNRAKLPPSIHLDIVSLDEDWPLINKSPSENLPAKVLPNQLAYIIYTSGSTGKPKGVMIEHGGVVNLALNQSRFLGVSEGVSFLQFASFGFDASCNEIFTSLLTGATLIMCKKEDLLSAESFEKLVTSHQVKIAILPPSFQNEVKDALGTIETIVSAGEPLNVATAKYIQSQGIRLINAYGPTENTVCATMSAQPVLENDTIVIGKPIDNVRLYVLSDHKQLVPLGVMGELCIAGSGLARGYLKRGDLTAEKFIANPFSNDASSRLYTTGDLGRLLPDGNIEYLGRKDDQLKIRGYRVEPGEIENVLLQSGLISQAVVIAGTDNSNNRQLVAYVITTGGSFDKQLIITYLSSRLPLYMVPALWVEMERFPVTTSGKIDKKALPDPDAGALLKNEYIAPRTAMEEKLAEIWKDLLGVERVGVYDNFFELGGHSLLAMRMVAYIEKSLLVSIPIKVLFRFTCISDLSKYLEIQAIEGFEQNEIPFKLLDI